MPLKKVSIDLSDPEIGWAPDIDNPITPSILGAENALPAAGGYRGVPDYIEETTPVHATEKVLNGISTYNSFGQVLNIVGTTEGLYCLNADNENWYSISPVGLTILVDNWSFTQIGGYIVASSDQLNHLLKFDLSIRRDNNGEVPTTFTEVATSPSGKYLSTINGFLVSAHPEESTIKVSRSARGNFEDWAISRETGAGFTNLELRHGPITGMAAYKYIVIFQESGITKMTPMNPPTFFRFDNIHNNFGCVSSESVVQHGDSIFFLGSDGFYMLVGGEELVPIGVGKINEWFLKTVLSIHLVRGQISPTDKQVYWSFSTISNDKFDKILVYNWAYNKWGLISQSHQHISTYARPGETLEGLDKHIRFNDLPDIDRGPQISFDSPTWRQSLADIFVFDIEGKRGRFAGRSKDVRITTSYMPLFGGENYFMNEIRPLMPLVTGPGETNILVNTRESLGQPGAPNSYKIRPNNRCLVRENGRYSQFILESSREFDIFAGFDVYGRIGGVR